MKKINERALNIVIADDDPDDQRLMQTAIAELNINHNTTFVYNGQQLLQYLLKKGPYKNSSEPWPDCIFLDLHMPLLTGADALSRIRKSANHEQTPIFIFSSACNNFEEEKLMQMGANGVYTKSTKHLNLKAIMHQILGAVEPRSPGSVKSGEKNNSC